MDSAIRHLIKYYRGDEDERHDRAFLWNLMSALWTMRNVEGMCDLPYAKPVVTATHTCAFTAEEQE
jgi:hypothetical protein